MKDKAVDLNKDNHILNFLKTTTNLVLSLGTKDEIFDEKVWEIDKVAVSLQQKTKNNGK